MSEVPLQGHAIGRVSGAYTTLGAVCVLNFDQPLYRGTLHIRTPPLLGPYSRTL